MVLRAQSLALDAVGRGAANGYGISQWSAWCGNGRGTTPAPVREPNSGTHPVRRRAFCGGGASGVRDPADYPAFMRYALRASLKAAWTSGRSGFSLRWRRMMRAFNLLAVLAMPCAACPAVTRRTTSHMMHMDMKAAGTAARHLDLQSGSGLDRPGRQGRDAGVVAWGTDTIAMGYTSCKDICPMIVAGHGRDRGSNQGKPGGEERSLRLLFDRPRQRHARAAQGLCRRPRARLPPIGRSIAATTRRCANSRRRSACAIAAMPTAASITNRDHHAARRGRQITHFRSRTRRIDTSEEFVAKIEALTKN